MNIENCIRLLLENVGFVMFLFAVILIVINRIIARPYMSNAEIIYRWIALFPLGITGIYAFVMHAFFPATAATSIGWLVSPFQTEVAMANLAMGALGILSFRASYGFRLATTVATTCWLGGDAIFHFDQIIRYHNFANGNAGTWLILDIAVPLLLIICMMQLRKEKKAFRIK